MFSPIYRLLPLFVPLLLASCGGKGKGDADSVATDSVPDYVGQIIDAVAHNDSVRFAKMVNYPLERPYPLRDIENEQEMEQYYPVMMDDSIRTAIGHSKPKQWEQVGWRGWTLHEGEWVWADSLIYSVNHVSRRELSERDSLQRAEIATLPQAMRSGWTPELCLKGQEGDIYRVDWHKENPDSTTYRLSIYRKGSDLKGTPTAVLYGGMELQGSEGNRWYTFTNTEGMTAIYGADVSGDEGKAIQITTPNGGEIMENVTPAYWRDLISK